LIKKLNLIKCVSRHVCMYVYILDTSLIWLQKFITINHKIDSFLNITMNLFQIVG